MKKFKQLTSFLLCFIMLFGVMPLGVFANEADDLSTVTNGRYDESGNWAPSDSGSITYTVDETDVTLSKTATPVAGEENKFEITLQVSTSTTTSTHTDGGAVVLVIDVSGSMAYCADCGNENGEEHEDDCPKNVPYTDRWGWTHNSDVSSSDSRMNAAKIAAENFLSSYAGTDPSAARMVAIVSFQSTATTRLDWVNVAGGPGHGGYDTALSTINGLSAKGGTNLDDGLYHALQLLNSDTVSDFSSKNVIALTDGAPTRSRTAGDGTRGSETINSHTAAQAANVRNTGATLYTVCFGVADQNTYKGGPTVGNFLRDSVASSGCAYNADNANELYSAFRAITESITSGLSGLGWTATDPMADMIRVSGGTGANFSSSDGNTYTWALSNAEIVTDGNKTTYVYTYKYTVELDVQGENFVEGQFFPTNERTYLNIGDGETLEFPVPGVKGRLPRTDVSVKKVWNDNNNQDGKRPDSITVQLMEGDTARGEPVVLNEGNNWSYTWNGEAYDLIEMSKGQTHVYTVVEIGISDDYDPTYSQDPDNQFALVVTNTHIPEKTSVTVTKTWDDAGNQDGKRPASITINLLANGEPTGKTLVLNKDNGWTGTFTDLDKYANGKEIAYTITEDEVENYETEIDGFKVTNSYTPETTSVSGSKTWNDNNNQDGKRPTSITIRLFADGKEIDSRTVTQTEGWKWNFENLPKYRDGGIEIIYTISEDEVSEYTSTVNGFDVTNTHIPETTSVSGSKTWDDNNNQDGARPESITIYLKANGNVVRTKTVTAADGWKWTFENLPKYENGTLISYSIIEAEVEGYIPEYNGYNVTNTHAPEKTSVTVTKVWNDNNNQDGIRANDIAVILLANGEKTDKTLVLNEGNKWTGSFTDLDKYENGTEIVYTVKEAEVNGYTPAITGDQNTGYTITNTHIPETVDISGTKTWIDADDQDGARPESITINLMVNGEVIATKTVTADDNWAWTFEDMPKYDQGVLISYSIKEEGVTDYSTSYDGYNVTNTHTPAQTSVTVTKSWQDNLDQDGIRPEFITVVLLANDVDTGKTLVLNEGNNWTGSFTELDEFAAGEKINYTVEEVTVAGYTTEISGTAKDGFTITNSHAPETTSVSGSKTWIDNDDQDGKRPDSITINLWADGVQIDSVTVTAEDEWAWSFDNLPKYKDHGTEIVYTVTEEKVEEYTSDVDGYNVTNTHAPEKTSVNVIKAWSDSNDQDGIRPEDITVVLLANGEETGKTLVLSEGNNWNATFTDLDKYEDGEVIAYTVVELAIEGYQSVITGDQNTGYTITNSHTPAVVEVAGSKTWVDADDQDGARPEEITINLLADGKIIDTVTVTAEDEWAWSFDNLPKYKDHGTEIVYTVTEVAVEDYSTTYDGYNVINTHTPAQTSVTVTKSWQDNNDQDGIRPEEITVILLANGEETEKTLTLNAENNWTGSFTELDVFAAGEKIVYTVKEVEVSGYTTVITGTAKDGFTVTNAHTPETVAVAGSKTWDDNNNQDGKRPESITINLLAGGKIVATKVVTEAEGWAWTFENLPKYENGGIEIVYAITEAAVEGYTTTYNGYNVTNSYTPAETSVTVSKTWADSNNAEGLRPDEVVILLFADGQDTGKTLTLNKDGNWVGSFTGLDKFKDGKEIVYTVKEQTVKGYNTVIRGDMASGFQVTNSRTYIPQTGDERTPALWISMIALSVLMMTAVVVYPAVASKRNKYAK